jgi:hypothetical protein
MPAATFRLRHHHAKATGTQQAATMTSNQSTGDAAKKKSPADSGRAWCSGQTNGIGPTREIEG